MPSMTRKIGKLYALLQGIADKQQGPWVILGHFNTVLFPNERVGSTVRTPKWGNKGLQGFVAPNRSKVRRNNRVGACSK